MRRTLSVALVLAGVFLLGVMILRHNGVVLGKRDYLGEMSSA